jgi:hypothetical protein
VSFDNDRKPADLTPEEMDILLYGKSRKYKLRIGDRSPDGRTVVDRPISPTRRPAAA